MRAIIFVVLLCGMLFGCATAPTPDQNLANELAYCGWLGKDLAKSDPKYDKPSTAFVGFATALTSQDYLVRAMMNDTRMDNIAKLPQKDKENEFTRCQSLVQQNWPQINAALARTYGTPKSP